MSARAKMLDLPGPGGAKAMSQLAHDFVHLSSPIARAKAICMVEKAAGENAADFDDLTNGPIAVCGQP